MFKIVSDFFVDLLIKERCFGGTAFGCLSLGEYIS